MCILFASEFLKIGTAFQRAHATTNAVDLFLSYCLRLTKHARAALAQVCLRAVDEPHREQVTVCNGEADDVYGGGRDAVGLGAA